MRIRIRLGQPVHSLECTRVVVETYGQQTLRKYNARLHRLEVLTFDQLVRLEDRVLSVFEERACRQRLPACEESRPTARASLAAAGLLEHLRRHAPTAPTR